MEALTTCLPNSWWAEKTSTVGASRWCGIPTLQHPFDAWITQEIICEVVPDLIVECGSWKGGSAVMWATLLGQINPHGRVLTIDIDGRLGWHIKRLPAFRRVDTLKARPSTRTSLTRSERQHCENALL